MDNKVPKTILDVLKTNGGAEYKAPKRVSDENEAERYVALYASSKEALDSFGELIFELGAATDMASLYHRNVLDGSRRRIREYFWGELRQVKHFQSPESISVFAEKCGEETRYRVSLEIDELHADEATLKKHNSLLDLPLADGCVIAINDSGVKDLIYTVSREEAMRLMRDSNYKKAQVCYLIQGCAEENLFQELVNGIGKIQPYYEYVIK